MYSKYQVMQLPKKKKNLQLDTQIPRKKKSSNLF